MRLLPVTVLIVSTLGSALGWGAPPVRVPSFGPNGTHWPDPTEEPPVPELARAIATPFPGDASTLGLVIDVACEWKAIGDALRGLTDEQVAKGVLIRVADGVLEGAGNDAGAQPVLADLGSRTWPQRVTVCPKNGYGAVRTGLIRFDRVHGIAWVGFNFGGIRLVGCDRAALLWSFVEHHFNGIYSSANLSVESIELYEVVFGIEARTTTSDRLDMFSSGANAVLQKCRLEGCYFSPNYRRMTPKGKPAPHVDTIQWAITSGGKMIPRYHWVRDNVVFASQAAAFQRCDYNFFDHNYIAGGATARTRYPYTEGSDGRGGNTAFGGSLYFNHSRDGIYVDANENPSAKPSADSRWASVERSRVTSRFTGSTPAKGRWTVDASLSAKNPPMPPIPDEAYRRRIWTWSGAETKAADTVRP